MATLPTLDIAAAAVIDAVFTRFQLNGDWPAFDEVDKFLDNRHGFTDADRMLQAMPPGLVVGLANVSHVPRDPPDQTVHRGHR